MSWNEAPPTVAGTYQWRRSPLWGPITRSLLSDGTSYSHRYLNYVAAFKLEGEWLY